MTDARADLRGARLRSHLLTAPAATIADAARHMTATQAQELWGGKFALAVRSAGLPSARDVDAAFDRGEIVRTWPMRGTLHIVHAADVAWLLGVVTDRVFRSAAARHRALGLDEADFARAERAARSALSAGPLPRAGVFDAFRAAGLDPSGQRGTHLLIVLAMRGVAHWGGVVARPDAAATEQLFTLNDDLPTQRATPADPAAHLFRRYLDGHGPASADDFAWWTGLPITQARRAAVAAADEGVSVCDGQLFDVPRPARDRAVPGGATVLPSFDEYYLAYRDRSVACDPADLAAVGPGANGMVRPVILRDGRVIATWTRAGAVAALDGPLPVDVLAGYRAHATRAASPGATSAAAGSG